MSESGVAKDGYVQVATDGSGKKIDNTEQTRNDDTVVERQRINISDESNPGVGGIASVNDKELQVGGRDIALLQRIADALERIDEKLNLLLDS